MNLARMLRTLLAAALLALPLAAQAAFDPVDDDTDIFLANPSFNATRPNVLIFLDNTANWSQIANGTTKYAAVRAALNSTLSGLSDAYNVGLGMFVQTGSPNDNVDGAYIRFGVRQLTGANKTNLMSMVTALSEGGDRSNNAVYSLAMAEMYRYFAGVTSVSGFGKAKRDYAGNTVYNSFAESLPGNPFVSAASSTYVSPISDGCQKNFIIFISNGEASDNTSSLADAQAFLSTLTGQATPSTITITPNGSQGNWSDEYAQFMANSDCNATFDGVQNVYTYTLDVIPKTTGQGPAHTALLKSMAGVGKGKYYEITDLSSTAQLTTALNAIFTEVQAVNSVFASTTLPVSVNVRGTNLNQVYIGVFRPDAVKSPRWLGNLKLYKLGVNTATQTLFLADATGAAAENSSTGFIAGTAQSFWTSSSTYWGYRNASLNGTGGSSDSPDGDLVEKGGAAQQVRLKYPSSQATRNLYTCTNGTGLCAAGDSLSSTPFATTNADVSGAALNAFTRYSVATLAVTSGTTVTLTLGAAPSPVWSAGDSIVISGASPNAFNGTFTLLSANNVTFTYTFDIGTAPGGDTARATAASHGLQSGDFVTVTGAAPAAFNVTDASVTRMSATQFDYPASGVSGSAAGFTVVGKKVITSLSGSGSIATAVVNDHGYAVGNTITVSGANETIFNKTANVASVTTNSFTYSISPDVVPTSGTTVKLTGTAHNISTAQTNVYVRGNTVGTYNVGPLTGITKLDNDSFTFSSTEVLTGTGGIVGVLVSNFSHPGSGSGPGAGCGTRDVLTVTTTGAHNIAGPFPFTITISGSASAQYNKTWTIASSADVPSSTTFVIDGNTVANQAVGGCDISDGADGAAAAGVVAGKAITNIAPVGTATGTLRVSKPITTTSISALTSASGTITAGRTADTDATLRANIINWVRGADNKEDENPVTTPAGSDIRPSVHGDVLHSRPAVINYNRFGDDNDVYAFYGGNDGIFRAVKGGLASSEAGIVIGEERWGFIPREFFGTLSRQRDQTPTISATNPKNYYADGSVGIYQKDANSDSKFTVAGGDKVYLYVTMRRGGRFMYALDVTDPADPKLLWRKGFGDAGWDMLGQTWSEPKITRVNASLGNASNPENVVLIFGAGYDANVEDVNPCLLNRSDATGIERKAVGSGSITYTAGGSCTIAGATGGVTTRSRSMGRGVLVVDAFNGNVVWQAGAVPSASGTGKKLTVPDMAYAMPADVALFDFNRNGIVERFYAGDTGGQMWRMDIFNTDMDEWTVTKIADMSDPTKTDITGQRKFLFPPDLVRGSDSSAYTAVLVGSGDREHPFDTNVVNAFYMIKDRDSGDFATDFSGATNNTSKRIAPFTTPGTPSPATHSTVFNATSAVVDSADALSLAGWRVNMAAGEKVISSATSIAGSTFFNTNQPSATAGGGSCGSNLGIAREYVVNFADASATIDLNASGGITIADRSSVHAGGGYLPSPVPVVVEIDGKKYQAVISGTSVRSPPGLTLDSRSRIFWYKELE